MTAASDPSRACPQNIVAYACYAGRNSDLSERTAAVKSFFSDACYSVFDHYLGNITVICKRPFRNDTAVPGYRKYAVFHIPFSVFARNTVYLFAELAACAVNGIEIYHIEARCAVYYLRALYDRLTVGYGSARCVFASDLVSVSVHKYVMENAAR